MPYSKSLKETTALSESIVFRHKSILARVSGFIVTGHMSSDQKCFSRMRDRR